MYKGERKMYAKTEFEGQTIELQVGFEKDEGDGSWSMRHSWIGGVEDDDMDITIREELLSSLKSSLKQSATAIDFRHGENASSFWMALLANVR